jgi:hypothetical protein
MSLPLFLYSTNTWLAYIISQVFYNQEHYVWCSPYFNAASIPASEQTTPPSSTPGKIYKLLLDDVISGDRHSTKIKSNKAGIRRGANYKLIEGVITEKKRLEIYATVSKAQIMEFRPIIYVIPYSLVANLVTEVPVHERSHPLSNECKIQRLPRQYFDIIDIWGTNKE